MALNTMQQTLGTQGMQQGFKHDVTGAPVGPYGHGVGGLFSMPGQDAKIFSAMLQPRLSIINDLPVLTADPIPGAGYGGNQQEFFTTITGVTASQQDDANQPTAECQPFPRGGLMKVCTLVSPMGRYGAQLDQLNIEQLGLLTNPADPTYLQNMNLQNPPLGPTAPGGLNNVLYNEFSRRAFTAIQGYALKVAQKIWTGDPALSASSNRWKDVLGLNTQINTGNKRDAISNTLCTIMDSDVKNYNYGIISGANTTISNVIDTVWYYLNVKAEQSGLMPVRWKLYMRSQMFDEITKIWPIIYYQQFIAAATAMGSSARFNFGSDVAMLRESMRQGMYLPIRGINVEVGLDDGIPERNSTTNSQLIPGQFASDIYFVPLTVLGGVPVTYIEPFNQANAITEQVIRDGRILNTFTSDGGMYRWYTLQTRGCVSWDFVSQFRLVLRTPNIAGRITNVGIQPLQHMPEAFNDSSYFSNGGRTNNPVTPSYYSEWGGSTPVQVN
jgi:hypothetical protein